MAKQKSFNTQFEITKKKRKSFDEYYSGILNSDINIVSQCLTLIESHVPEDNQLAQKILDKCLQTSKRSRKIGITGIPGVGKSTFIEQYGLALIRKGQKVAVLAIDPSSDISGGSILGDKTRMTLLSEEKNAFIRPSPSKGILGGVAQKTHESITICEAAGFDTIIIETVGVGQSESVMANMIDFFLLLTISNTGDDLQGIKRGILEQAHGIAFTKYDGPNIMKTDLAKKELEQAIHFIPSQIPDWSTPVLITSSQDRIGFEEIDSMIQNFYAITESNGFLEKKRKDQKLFWFKNSIEYFLTSFYMQNKDLLKTYNELLEQISSNKITPTRAAKTFIEKIMSQ